MIRIRSFILLSIAAALFALLPLTAAAAPIVFSGSDAGNSVTTNSDAAFSSWSAAVGAYTLDNLDGLAGTQGFGGTVTSGLGNTFTSSDDLVSVVNFGVGVLDGTNLRLSQQGGVTDFVWDVAEPVSSFGFFARNNDGALITISFDDGSSQVLSLRAAGPAGPGDNLFWGVTNLAGAVQSIAITSTDPGTGSNGGNSHWDRFVYESVGAVPEPGAAILFALGLLTVRSAWSRR